MSSLSRAFRALVSRTRGQPAQVETWQAAQDLPKESMVKVSPGEASLVVEVGHSSLNYKDALVVTGKYAGLKTPMVGGIDLTGTVIQSKNFKEGDEILVNGWGVGTDHFGGYAELASLRPEWAMPVPKGLSGLDCAKIGIAGYTAMLCVDALVRHGIKPEDGPILVTGATGGVGSISIGILAQMGYHPVAVTGKAASTDWLMSLGAKEIKARSDFETEPKTLGRELWAGCIDAVGGKVLANALSGMKYGGSVAACGLAGSMSLPTSVAPFILRGVSLLGVDSVFVPMAKRAEIFDTYSGIILESGILDRVSGEAQVLKLEQVPKVAAQMLEGGIQGRYIVSPRS
eukprot:maker-scaffold1258_size52332-snap-gene-0.11 protein:Tk02596 transcript:maker-scaffold1258_size52332-snap-gene-0.11-mRNA-1 annotation:"zinc-binding alcohol dehydrogenase-like protein"